MFPRVGPCRAVGVGCFTWGICSGRLGRLGAIRHDSGRRSLLKCGRKSIAMTNQRPLDPPPRRFRKARQGVSSVRAGTRGEIPSEHCHRCRFAPTSGSGKRDARDRLDSLTFSRCGLLHYGKVCPCILRRDILPSNSAGASSSPLRPCADPSPRALRTRSRPHLPRNRPPRPTRPPTAPFPIIPIDTSSTWVCPWCFVGVVLTGAAPRQSHVRLLRISR